MISSGAQVRDAVFDVMRTRGLTRIFANPGSTEVSFLGAMPDDFEYVSQSRLEYRHGYRHAYLGDVPAPVVYGVQGRLREYYGVAEGPPVASTLDHIVAAVAG